jgi:hypothetical protein
VFFHLSSRHCHFVQLNDSEFLKYCRMMTLIRIVFLFLTLLFPKRWISQKYRITQSKFTLSYFILANDCTYRLAKNHQRIFYNNLRRKSQCNVEAPIIFSHNKSQQCFFLRILTASLLKTILT